MNQDVLAAGNRASFMTAGPRRRQEERPSSRSLLGNGVGPPLTRSAPRVGMRSLPCDLPCLLGCIPPLALRLAGAESRPRQRIVYHLTVGVQWPFVTVSLRWSAPELSRPR